MRWWQLGTPVFVAMLAFAFFYAATEIDALLVPVLLGRFGGLLTLVVGGVIATVQAAKQPSATPVGALVAPIVGYTAEGQPVYGAPASSRSTNVCAILALVFGLLGGLLGVVFGHIALSQISRTGENGRGLAVAGLALGYLSVAVWSIFIIAVISAAVS